VAFELPQQEHFQIMSSSAKKLEKELPICLVDGGIGRFQTINDWGVSGESWQLKGNATSQERT
jgi:hypothetical protein